MNTRLVVCLALVAMAMVPAYANEGKGMSLGGSVSGSLSVQKDVSVEAAAPTPAANPSAPVDAGSSAGKGITLAAPVIDVQIKKVPLVTVTDAPCQKVCKPKCSISFEKSCTTVPVTNKECETVTKTVTKRMCSKKCTITTPAVEVPSKDKPDSMPNPSAPVPAPAADSDVSAGAKSDASMSAGKSGSVTVTIGKGRKLQGLPLLAGKAAIAKAIIGHMPDKMDCEDVCNDVPSEQSELVCKDVTTQVEKCVQVPKTKCEEECVCIPMKSVSLNLQKPISFSMGKGN